MDAVAFRLGRTTVANRPKLHRLIAFGQTLERLRIEKRIAGLRKPPSMDIVADESGVPKATLRKYEKGKTWQADPVHLQRLAVFYEVAVGQLIFVIQMNRDNAQLTADEAWQSLHQAKMAPHAAPPSPVNLEPVQRRLHDIAGEIVTLAEQIIAAEASATQQTTSGMDKKHRRRR